MLYNIYTYVTISIMYVCRWCVLDKRFRYICEFKSIWFCWTWRRFTQCVSMCKCTQFEYPCIPCIHNTYVCTDLVCFFVLREKIVVSSSTSFSNFPNCELSSVYPDKFCLYFIYITDLFNHTKCIETSAWIQISRKNCWMF